MWTVVKMEAGGDRVLSGMLWRDTQQENIKQSRCLRLPPAASLEILMGPRDNPAVALCQGQGTICSSQTQRNVISFLSWAPPCDKSLTGACHVNSQTGLWSPWSGDKAGQHCSLSPEPKNNMVSHFKFMRLSQGAQTWTRRSLKLTSHILL